MRRFRMHLHMAPRVLDIVIFFNSLAEVCVLFSGGSSPQRDQAGACSSWAGRARMGYGSLIDGLKPENRRANTFAQVSFPDQEI